ALDRGVHHLERSDVVERDQVPRPALARAELVENAVLRHLEEPGRELAAQRELREALEDAEEDLLGQVLGQSTVADQSQDVVEDGRLVGPDDDREGTLVTPLCFAQDTEVRLLE